jgi:hypothetical protein
MVFGVLMTLLGIVLYVVSNMVSPTALIPAAFGVPLLILGAVGWAGGAKARMHTMHGAAMVGLVGVVASLVVLGKRLSSGTEWNLAMTGMALLALLNAIFVGLCVNSFIAARRARKAAGGPPAP